MEKITKINDTTVEIETTIIQKSTISIDDLQAQIDNFRGDIANATSSYNKQIEYLQSEIDAREEQILSIKNLGVISEKEKIDADNLVKLEETPMDISTSTEEVIK